MQKLGSKVEVEAVDLKCAASANVSALRVLSLVAGSPNAEALRVIPHEHARQEL